MNRVLNIVNGNIVINLMKKSTIPGTFLAWNDFLHEGPVLEGLSLEELSKVRAEFISEKGLGEFEEIYREFKERDTSLKAFKKYEKIILWFEHDLYDQLQLIQILDWFGKYADTHTRIYIISPENYLGRCTPNELKELLLYNKERVSHNHFIVARKAWSAFSSKTPKAWEKLLRDDISALPFLKDTIRRMLEEFPNTKNGLSRTTHQALLCVSEGQHRPMDIFEDYQRSEERIFMGDVLFWDILKKLVNSDLLNATQNGQHLTITPLGTEVLMGEKNWLEFNSINSWIGGVHLTPSTLWCWDIPAERVLKYNFVSNHNTLPSHL
jgi:hypothetical protein